MSSQTQSGNVDWECQNCGEYWRGPRNADRTGELPRMCLWCKREVLWEIAERDTRYVLTDAEGEIIPGEEYDHPSDALDSRATLMAEHEDGDDVTVEEREYNDG